MVPVQTLPPPGPAALSFHDGGSAVAADGGTRAAPASAASPRQAASAGTATRATRVLTPPIAADPCSAFVAAACRRVKDERRHRGRPREEREVPGRGNEPERHAERAGRRAARRDRVDGVV